MRRIHCRDHRIADSDEASLSYSAAQRDRSNKPASRHVISKRIGGLNRRTIPPQCLRGARALQARQALVRYVFRFTCKVACTLHFDADGKSPPKNSRTHKRVAGERSALDHAGCVSFIPVKRSAGAFCAVADAMQVETEQSRLSDYCRGFLRAQELDTAVFIYNTIAFKISYTVSVICYFSRDPKRAQLSDSSLLRGK